VILVTTKTGKVGRPSIEYHGYTTVQTLTKNFNQYDGQQYIDLKREDNRIRDTKPYLNDEQIISTFKLEALRHPKFVDWENMVLNDAVIQNHSLSFSSGTEKTKIYSSVNYFTQEGIIPNSGFDRGSLKLNLEHKLTDRLTFRGILNYQNAKQDRETGGLNFTTITPLAMPYDNDGN